MVVVVLSGASRANGWLVRLCTAKSSLDYPKWKLINDRVVVRFERGVEYGGGNGE